MLCWIVVKPIKLQTPKKLQMLISDLFLEKLM